jgi:hypothetical protein
MTPPIYTSLHFPYNNPMRFSENTMFLMILLTALLAWAGFGLVLKFIFT